MQRIVNPRQTCLFDPFDVVLTPTVRRRLLDSWPGVLRYVLLELMPVDALRQHFHPTLGRPTRELYSMAGLILLMEAFDWTKEQAVNAYCLYTDVQFALNLEPVAHDLSVRTLERYLQYFEQDELSQQVMHRVTTTLVQRLDLKIDQQRLDSTHVFSDMYQLGRTRLLGVAIKRFLTAVRRHDPAAYASLPEALRQRYTPSEHQLFGDTTKAKDQEARRLLRQQVAEDLHQLLRLFADQPAHANRSSYQAMERIFYEQCEVQEEKVIVKDKTGGTVMQNPSDPDATYDGHKGAGYQAQVTETCHPDNEAQLITCVLPQTAAEPDGAAVAPVLEDLKASGLLPEELLADTQYPDDENVQLAESYGVELVGPVPGAEPSGWPDDLTIDDFVIDETTEQVTCCPDGHAPVSSVPHPASGRTHTTMPARACGPCAFRHQCPVQERQDGYHLEHTAKQRRMAARRREQQTEVFRERYRRRSGIESTNSGLKRRMGLGRLRVRGRPRVFQAIYLKVTGWNILRASVCAKMREFVRTKAQTAVFCLWTWVLTLSGRPPRVGDGRSWEIPIPHSLLFRVVPLARPA
jgi:hypothetical protein